MRVRLVSSAAEDLREGFRFYEEQQDGLGTYFLESVLSDLRLLRTNAGIHSKAIGYHRKISDVFPFGIYYRCGEFEVIVVGILDLRRDPELIRQRLHGL